MRKLLKSSAVLDIICAAICETSARPWALNRFLIESFRGETGLRHAMPPTSLIKRSSCLRLGFINGYSHSPSNFQALYQIAYNKQACYRQLSTSSSRRHSSALLPVLSIVQPRNLARDRIHLLRVRHLSINPKKWAKFKDDFRLALKYAAYFYAFVFLFSLMSFGAKDERYNRLFPTPSEWGWFLRRQMRRTRGDEVFYDTNDGIPQWPAIGMQYRNIVNRLEENKKSINIPNMPMEEKVRLAKAGVASDGFNFEGIDVSKKSVPWREGYYTALMGAARAAEFLDGLVADVTRRQVFSKDRVIGPSNPNPMPQPYGAIEAPLEENCADAFLSPKIFYNKIMMTEGFNARQRLETSLAWANWLAATGQNEEAEDKYDWALDIAVGDLPHGINNIVDTRTGCINTDATYITEGIITATTALATFHAQRQNFSTALPIFASIIRAYRSLPPPTEAPIPIYSKPVQDESAWSLVWSTIVSALSAPTYPDAPPSISVPLISTPKQTCAEAAIMSNLGEVMFASSKLSPSSSLPSRTASPSNTLPFSKPSSQPIATPAELSGLSWTSSAVDQTEATIDILINSPPRWKRQTEIQELKEYCAECLTMAIENWRSMVSMLEEREYDREMEEKKRRHTQGENAHQGWSEWTRSLFTSRKAPDPLQEKHEVDSATADAEPSPVQVARVSAASSQGTILEQTKTSSQGPWAQETRKVERRFLEVRKKMREERIQKKDMAEKGLWGFG